MVKALAFDIVAQDGSEGYKPFVLLTVIALQLRGILLPARLNFFENFGG
jgi:hypothetical protein